MKTTTITGTLCAAVLGLGCAGAPKPTNQLVGTEAALRAVEEVGVDDAPRAELHQTLAKEQLAKARKLMEDDENARAEWTLQRAKADAELALALAREQEAKTSAEDAEASLDAAKQPSTSRAMHVQTTRSN